MNSSYRGPYVIMSKKTSSCAYAHPVKVCWWLAEDVVIQQIGLLLGFPDGFRSPSPCDCPGKRILLDDLIFDISRRTVRMDLLTAHPQEPSWISPPARDRTVRLRWRGTNLGNRGYIQLPPRHFHSSHSSLQYGHQTDRVLRHALRGTSPHVAANKL